MKIEAIESTLYVSNDLINWTLASVERVWLEGWPLLLGIQWDGFTYVVGTGNHSNLYRYASIIQGGDAALQHDGDNEINGMLGLNDVPEPASAVLIGLVAIFWGRRRR